MSKTMILVNNEIYKNNSVPKDTFASQFGSWATSDDTALRFDNTSSGMFGYSQISAAGLYINPDNPFSQEAHYVTKLYVHSVHGEDLSNYITLDKRYSYFATAFLVSDLATDIENINSSEDTSLIPPTDIDFDYEIENIEYENLNASAPNELALLNYYEPLQDQLLLKNDPVVLLQNSIEKAAVRGDYENVVVAPDELPGVLSANTYAPDDREVRVVDPLQDAPDATATYMERLPFVNRINIQNFEATPLLESSKFVLNNLMFFDQEYLPEELENYFDLGTLMMRWHCQQKDVLNKGETFVYTRAVSTGDGEVADINVVQELYSYDLIDWINNYAPASIATPLDIKYISGDGPLENPSSINMADDNYADGGLQLTTALKAFAANYFGAAGGDPGFVNAESPLSNKLMSPSIMEVLRGNVGFSETLFYRVSKYEGLIPEGSTGTPIQSFYIPANKSNNIIRYLDTQVFYNKEYTYKIFAVKAVAGCEYEYTDIKDLDPGKYEVTVKAYPKIKIIELPVFEKINKILANPPLPPAFEFVPIRRVQNKFKMIFNSNLGIELMTPTPITDTDNRNIQYIRDNKYIPADNGIFYSDTSTTGRFEIYQSSNRPLDLSTFADFRNNLFASVDTDVDTTSKLRATSAAAILNLIPNKKYYFVFVSRNRLGLASNPTRAFEVEIVNDGGLSYPVIKPLEDIAEKITRKPTKTLTKIVTIRPNVGQVQIDYEASGLIDSESNPLDSRMADITLGTKEEGSFGAPGTGKKFKFRFKSKKTNRMFDINVTCKNTKILTDFQTGVASPIAEAQPQDSDISGFLDSSGYFGETTSPNVPEIDDELQIAPGQQAGYFTPPENNNSHLTEIIFVDDPAPRTELGPQEGNTTDDLLTNDSYFPPD
tara:strand:- start:5359 stop:8022 length:2664 start_codon:yes stop_codon:yes gene_type:complete